MSADMYTPRRRSSISESTYRFTPSKRGQAALDALALGYDVQLPDYSFALLPRSATSEQALASIISTTASSSMEQVPRSASYREPSHRATLGSSQGSSQGHPSSEAPDRRRFARQVRSPRRENVLYSSPNKDTSLVPLATRPESPSSVIDSRPSTSSFQSDVSQYILSTPARDHSLRGPTHQEQLSVALLSLNTPKSSPHSPAQSGYHRRQSMSRNRPSPPKLSTEASEGHIDPGQERPTTGESTFGETQRLSRLTYERNDFARISPVKTIARLPVAPPHDHSSNLRSRSPAQLRINTEGLNERNIELTFSTHDPRYLRTRSAVSPLFPAHSLREHNDRSSSQIRQQTSRASMQYRHSISTAHPSSIYHASTLPTIDEPRFLSAQNTRIPHPMSDSSAPLRRYSNRSQHSQFGASLRPESPSLSSTSVPSPHKSSAKLSHHEVAPSLHNFAPSSSGKSTSPRTPGTSLPGELDDEDFRVHPERAAISRMESLLMLSACRHEAEGRWPAGDGSSSSTGYEAPGFSGGPGYGSNGMNGIAPGFNQRGMVYPMYNAYGHGFPPDFGGRLVQTPPGVSHQFGFQAGSVPSNHVRASGGGRGRQRSESMHVFSPQRQGSRQGSPPRHRQSHIQSPQRQRRQRSMSLAVHGLSPEAVKKLRAYETMKGREGGREDRLGQMVGVGSLPVKGQGSKEAKVKKVTRSPPGPKPSLSPAQVPTPIEPCAFVAPQMDTPSMIAPSSSIPAPQSPANIPLPSSPLNVLPISPAQIALPPSPGNSPALGLLFDSPSATEEPASVVSPLVSSDSFMKYRASHGIESPRPIRTRQNTVAGRTVPTFRLISSPEKAERPVLGPQLDATAGESHACLGGLDTPSVRIDSLKLDPTIERIITPPPSFWSPPPLSPAVRTSAPLLPAAVVGSSRRPMSVPPPGVGEAQIDDVRRAWSCEPPANVEVQVGRSFAGDWSQCMVIDVSDEEDEGDMVTDASLSEDESELEEGEIESAEGSPKNLQVLKVDERLKVVAETVERDEIMRDSGDSVDYVRIGGGASKYYLSKGNPNSGSGSGVNAVEAVQSAIVKLAMDNAGLHSQRMQSLQSKRSSTPPVSAGLIRRYPPNPRRQQKQSIDHSLYSQASQIQASINAYFDPPTVRPFQPNVPVQQSSYPKPNPTLDSLRSGLEQRVAASANAVEEAVRARNVAPNVSKQPARNATGHSLSISTLPPRLQRLHGIHTWNPPKLSLAQLEIPPFSRAPSSSQPSAHSYHAASSMPSPMVAQPLATQWPVTPGVELNSTKQPPSAPNLDPPSSSLHLPPSAPSTSDLPIERKAKGRSPQLQPIVIDSTPIPAPPRTTPLARSKRAKHSKRRSADEVPSKTKDESVSLPTGQPTVSLPPQLVTPAVGSAQEPIIPSSSQPPSSAHSPPAKSRSRYRHQNRQNRSKKDSASGKQDAPTTSSSSTSVPIPSVPPPPPPALVNSTPSPIGIQEITTTTKGPRKRKSYKNHKTNKASSIPTAS